MDTVGRPSPSFILVGRGSGTGSGVGGGSVIGVDAFFFEEAGGCGVASEARLFAADSRRSRAGSLRFSTIAEKHAALCSYVSRRRRERKITNRMTSKGMKRGVRRARDGGREIFRDDRDGRRARRRKEALLGRLQRSDGLLSSLLRN